MAKARIWAKNNRDRVRELHQKAYQRNKAVIALRAKQWSKENPEKRRDIAQKSALKHVERKRAQSREYGWRIRLERPDEERAKGRVLANRRRCRVMQCGGEVSQENWDGLLELFEFGTCLYCKRNNQKLTMDHFVPFALGGRNEVGNLIPCCKSCNSKKGAKPPQDWIRQTLGDNAYGEICWFLDLTREALIDVKPYGSCG